ncbi:MAG: DUF1566 domain-containing protein, partial [Treponema sp.]|nr:DUF1566 domain-containing protein [Treponema sp.]
TVTVEYAIGDAGPAGGIIFYVDSADTYPLWKYLEAAPADIGTMAWVISGTTYANSLIGGTSQAIGTGKDNTVAILAAADTDAPAAKACDDYSSGGFDDWFLPSLDELYEMHLNRTAIGGVPNGFYWSSSEATYNFAEYRHFDDYYSFGTQFKYATHLVRPIRAF